MFTLRKMKYIELSVLKNDINAVLEYLGRKAAVQFPDASDTMSESPEASELKELIDRLYSAGCFLNIDFNPEFCEGVSASGGEAALAHNICAFIEQFKDRCVKTEHEISRLAAAADEIKAFSKMDMPLSDFDHLSFLTLRVGQIDSKSFPVLCESLGDRALIVSLYDDAVSGGKKIIAASSKKGRFALDAQLKKASFEPAAENKNDALLGADICGAAPAQILERLIERQNQVKKELEKLNSEKEKIKNEHEADLRKLASLLNVKLTIEKIKSRFTETESLYHFSGWTPADMSVKTTKDLMELTNRRIAINAYPPNEVPSIKSGKEKVPVAMKHNAFVKGFEGVVFSYGAPLYGTIDPTVLVAVFFTIMFGIMFGDAGQGLILLLLGILTGKSKKFFGKFKKFSVPLISVGISSAVMGFLYGSFFTNEKFFVAPTQKITNLILGHPADRILHVLPMSESGGSITKLLYFFGFTIAVGVIINSLGLLINIYNCIVLRKYQTVFFSKTGIPGLFLFWYAICFVLRLFFGGKIQTIDLIVFSVPLLCIVFGRLIWRVIKKEKPLLENGLLVFVIEGFVEIMETISSYFSNTVSFLRVGAFALAHAVFSFIIFYFTEQLTGSGFAGAFCAALIMIAGNVIIIALEGLIVAIQVMRLNYYEFFNKFFMETGAKFAPFRFSKQ